MHILSIVQKINSALLWIGSVLLAISCLIAMCNALARKFFSAGFAWGEELTTYLVVVVLFISLPYLEQYNKHLSVNVLMSFIKDAKKKRIIMDFSRVVTVFIMGVMLYHGIFLAINMYETNIVTYVMQIPRVIFFSIMLAGFVMIIIASISNLIFRKGGALNAD